MRAGPLVAGIIALVVGIALISLTFVSSSLTIPASGSYVPVAPHSLGGGTLTVSWSGAPAASAIAVYHCGAACVFTSQTGCSGMPCTAAGGPTAVGHGGSGSLSVSVDGSSSYAVLAQGTSQPISASTTLTGLTLLMLLGVIVAILGIVLLALSRGGPSRTPSSGAAEDAAATEEAPAEEEDDGIRWEAPAPAAPVVAAAPAPKPAPARKAYVAPPPPPREEPEEEEAAPAAPFQARPTLICAKCGTPNEPWITQCRKCKRPLSSTGQG